MQIVNPIEFIGTIVILAGIILIILAIMLMFQNQVESPSIAKKESKGIILLGPIPIVWGFGNKGKGISILLVLSVVIIWILFWLF